MEYYKIAGQKVAMELYAPKLQESAEKYRCEKFEQADIVLQGYGEAAYRNHMLVPQVSEADWVEILSADDFYDQLLAFRGFFLHSSAVIAEGKAYLISAGSQIGKSTHTKLWQDYLGKENARILNDDKPALRLEKDGIWYAYGTPWSGASDSNLNLKVPIGGICVLERSDVNWIQREGGPILLNALLEQTLKPREDGKKQILLELFTNLMANIPTYRMGCDMTLEAGRMAYEFMTGRIAMNPLP